MYLKAPSRHVAKEARAWGANTTVQAPRCFHVLCESRAQKRQHVW